jgi:CheY-like chemotaxis protein
MSTEVEITAGTADAAVEPIQFRAKAHAAFCEALDQKLRTPLNAIIGFTELAVLDGGRQRTADLQQVLKAARDLLQIIEAELGAPRHDQPAADEPAPMSERRCDVLYIEDDPVNFVLVERILGFRPGLEVLHAPQGHLGVELALAYQPQLVLLDLNLPDMHGSDVLRVLQANSATENIPVVVLSADATPSQIERLLTAGAKNYLTKPFDLEPFLAVVDDYVQLDTRRVA